MPREKSSPTPSRRPITSALAAVTGLGFAYGALVYGVPVAVLHVLHNRLGSLREASVLGVELALLYGGAAALLTAAGALPVLLGRTAGKRARAVVPDELGRTDSPDLAGWPLRTGLLLFGLAFWLPIALWGLTYDQTIAVEPRTGSAMVAYLACAVLLVSAAVGAGTWLVDRAVRSCEEARRLPRALAFATALAALAVVVATLSGESLPSARPVPAVGLGEARDEPKVEAAGHDTKVVLVGFDGMDPRVIDRLVGEGTLPTFSRLRKEGVYGPLETLPDANSAVLWASIYTGLAPDDHGVLDFYRIHLPGVSTGLFPVHRTFFREAADLFVRVRLARRDAIARDDLAAPPVWEIADWLGLSVGLIDGYLFSFPALSPRSDGGYVLGHGLDDFAARLASGRSRPEELGLYLQPPSMLADIGLPQGEDFQWQARATLDLLAAREQPRLLSFYCHEPDRVQHSHWRGFEPWRYLGQQTSEVSPAGGEVVDMHRRFDAFLAELLDALDPETTLIVVSDHGHSPTLVDFMDTQHRHGPPGVLLLHGGPIRGGSVSLLQSAHIYDVAPTVLHLLGLPVPRDLPGRVLVEAITRDSLARQPVRRIASYRQLVPSSRVGTGRSEAANDDVIEELRRLGYVW